MKARSYFICQSLFTRNERRRGTQSKERSQGQRGKEGEKDSEANRIDGVTGSSRSGSVLFYSPNSAFILPVTSSANCL